MKKCSACKDKARHAATKKRWSENNPVRVRALQAKAEAVARGAQLPDDFDLEETLPFYAEARRRTIETGIQHDVDHIVACASGGMHCPSNLQVLTALENKQKGNK